MLPAVVHNPRMTKFWRTWPERLKARKGGKVDADIAAEVSELLAREFGEEYSRGRGSVNHWLNGTRPPTLPQFFALCEVIGADPQEILFGVPSANHAPHRLEAVRTPRAAEPAPAPYHPSDRIREFKSKARRARRRLLP